MNLADLPERITKKIDFNSPEGHWLWSGRLTEKKYGQVYYNGGAKQAHRVIYGILIEEIPPNLVYRHGKGCPRHCVNPYHARPPGTHLENSRDMAEDGTTYHRPLPEYCLNGHRYSDENTYTHPLGKYHYCKTCMREKIK